MKERSKKNNHQQQNVRLHLRIFVLLVLFRISAFVFGFCAFVVRSEKASDGFRLKHRRFALQLWWRRLVERKPRSKADDDFSGGSDSDSEEGWSF